MDRGVRKPSKGLWFTGGPVITEPHGHSDSSPAPEMEGITGRILDPGEAAWPWSGTKKKIWSYCPQFFICSLTQFIFAEKNKHVRSQKETAALTL